eukprot:1051959_1
MQLLINISLIQSDANIKQCSISLFVMIDTLPVKQRMWLHSLWNPEQHLPKLVLYIVEINVMYITIRIIQMRINCMHCSMVYNKIKLHTDFNVKILGAFIGTDEFIKSNVSKIAMETSKMMDSAACLTDNQCGALILSNCFDNCRVTYTMRTIPPSIIESELRAFDDGLKNAIDVIMGRILTDDEFDNYTLNVKDGGHGVRVAYEYSEAAFLGSFYESKQFVEDYLEAIGCINCDVESLLKIKDIIDTFCVKYDAPKHIFQSIVTQKQLSEYVDDFRSKRCQSKQHSLQSKARYKCSTATSAGAWITAIPTTKRLRLSPKEYLTACYLRYGWDLFDGVNRCIDCGEVIDKLGIHCLHCGKYGGWTTRHNKIRDCLYHWCTVAQFCAKKELEGLLLSGRKPVDIFVYSYLDRIDYAFDVTVVSPYKYDLIRNAARELL